MVGWGWWELGFLCWVDPQEQVVGWLTPWQASLTWTRLLSAFVGLFTYSLALHSPLAFPSSPPCPACSTTWVLIKHGTGDTISEDRHYEFPDWPSASFLQLPFSLSICLQTDPCGALCLWTSFLLTAAPCYKVDITCLFDLFTPQPWPDCPRLPMLHSSLFWTFPCMSLHGTAWDWLQVWTWEQECWVKVICLLTSTKYHQLRSFQKAGTRPHFAHRLLYHLTNYPAL